MRRRCRDFAYTPCLSPIVNVPHSRGTVVTFHEPTLTYHCPPESIVYIRVHSRGFGVVHPMGLVKCVMTCIHHYGISIFAALKILCALSIHSSLAQPLAAADIFTVAIVLTCPECHRVGIRQYVAFLDWLHS